MKPSELLLKALETEFVGELHLSQEYEVPYQRGERAEHRRILAILQDSGVLDVLDAADKAECVRCGFPEELANALSKLRERLGEK